MSPCGRLVIFHVIVAVVVLLNSRCHTKGIRPERAANSEQQFMKWVGFVGSLKHSLFKTATNKVSPSRIITVHKNPKYGDYTSIQDAIHSLPTINLLRVVIKVHAGLYTTVFYGQYKCTGEGAKFAGRVAWSRELTDEEAKPFISLNFIHGTEWITI